MNKYLDKLFELFCIIILALSYVLVYDLAKYRSTNICQSEYSDLNDKLMKIVRKYKL